MPVLVVKKRSCGAYAFEKQVWLVCSFCLCKARMVGVEDVATGTMMSCFPWTTPTTRTVPSTLHESDIASPSMSSFVVHVLLFVSQKRTVPSLEQLASSNSLTGLYSTFSTEWLWPLSSICCFGWGFSGFQIRIVLSVAPVAICVPVKFQDMVLWL